ncbi:beta-glucosidase-like protein [Byssothecium circinans]|uniref:Beta-glucosidase-like protein n=1 Tax=Byssothecium circinans TaxID=147558 RepID=A0A6A5TRI0_9PLEO|nr:beta-glucosidase-like protein [Byssothecium circinans]
MRSVIILTCVGVVLAQQVYIPFDGPSARPQCAANGTYATATPSYTFREFSYTQTETVRTATSIPAPTTTTTFAPPYASVSHLVPNLTTTQWGNWDPSATSYPTDVGVPYGNASWSALWTRIPVANFTRGIYSSTVEPTPVPASELVLPPPDYFGPRDCYYFPADFMLGVSSSAPQIEGAVADEGMSPTAMTYFHAMRPGASSNFITNENYYLYKQDIERLASMGVRYYSFSIAWARILPFVTPGSPVNKQGLDHYDDLINFVLQKGMLPAVTLIHFDAPMLFYNNITDTANRPGSGLGYLDHGYSRSYKNATFEDAFVHYGKVLMTHFGDRVPVWFTFNEPLLGSANGKAIDTVLKSHARLAHFYREELNGTGKVSIKLNDNFGVPLDPQNAGDIKAANHFNSFQLATFGNPLFLGLDYPESFKITVTDYVPLSAEDIAYINGTADFLGIDPYTATVITGPPNSTIEACAADRTNARWPYCVTQSTLTSNGWNIGYRSQTYVYLTPTYFRTYLNYLWNTFKVPIAITEFGFPIFGEDKRALPDQLFDSPRSWYYQSFLSEGLKAIWEDGVNLIGAFAWSYADNWEFGDYTAHYGIQTVNRTTQEKRYKKSFFDFVDFVESRRQGVK